MSDCCVLMVVCCLEQSRHEILQQVVDNLLSEDQTAAHLIHVFDNASTVPETAELLKKFDNVYRADRNVGYWSAIDWWLEHLQTSGDVPTYTYIVESDMMHYGFRALGECVRFLDAHPELGSMRLHEYSIRDRRYYNKDAPITGSRSNLWQSHTNKVTGQAVVHEQVDDVFWKTNFLTQLPALNRYQTMKEIFDVLALRPGFSELDFQRLYHAVYPQIAILDGGIFNCDLNPHGSKNITGSWTDPAELSRIGYQATRHARIIPRDQYTVKKVV